MLIFSSCPKGITRLFLGRRTSNTRASSVFRSDGRPPRDHPFTRPLGPGDIARGSPEPGEAGRPAATVDPGSSFPWSAPARGRREGGGIPAAEQERGARGALARSRGECLPRGGGRGDAGAPIGRCFEETPAGDARGGAAARFQGLPPVQLPPENVAASRRSLPGGRCQARCASVPMATARTDRGCIEHPQGRQCGQRDAFPLQGS